MCAASAACARQSASAECARRGCTTAACTPQRSSGGAEKLRRALAASVCVRARACVRACVRACEAWTSQQTPTKSMYLRMSQVTVMRTIHACYRSVGRSVVYEHMHECACTWRGADCDNSRVTSLRTAHATLSWALFSSSCCFMFSLNSTSSRFRSSCCVTSRLLSLSSVILSRRCAGSVALPLEQSLTQHCSCARVTPTSTASPPRLCNQAVPRVGPYLPLEELAALRQSHEPKKKAPLDRFQI